MGFADALAVGTISLKRTLGDDHEITYVPSVGDPEVVEGIFTEPYQGVDIGERGGGISTEKPTCYLTLSELPSDPEVDTLARLLVDGTKYRWTDSQPDGAGGILLILNEVTA